MDAVATVAPFNRVYLVGYDTLGDSYRTIGYPVYVQVKWNDERLSISGVTGPRANGNAEGSCGQMLDDLLSDTFTPANDWTPQDVHELHTIWDRWHLNDMRAGCEHQRAMGWGGSTKLTLYRYRLTPSALKLSHQIERDTMTLVKTGALVKLDAEQLALINLPYEFVSHLTFDELPVDQQANYELKGRPEIKYTGQTYPSEHPDGVLCKPCPTCGYEYGTKWLKEEVPIDVLERLLSFPTDDTLPIRWR